MHLLDRRLSLCSRLESLKPENGTLEWKQNGRRLWTPGSIMRNETFAGGLSGEFLNVHLYCSESSAQGVGREDM